MNPETAFMLRCLCLGAYITFVYDWLRVLRRVISHGFFATAVEDVLFWLYCGGKVFLMLQRQNHGILRWFAVMGALIGILTYHKFIGERLVPWVSKAIQRTVRKCVPGRSLKKRLTFFWKVLRMKL